MEPIYFHRYSLTSRTSLNSNSERVKHEGALVRVGGGYGCIHPWPELGDDPIDKQLSQLKAGSRTPLIESALRCAEADLDARKKERPLICDPIPKSHWLILAGDNPTEAVSSGFLSAKLKIGCDLESEIRTIHEWVGAGWKVRLDCNENLSLATFFELWKSVGSIRESIEFVEDPTDWSEESWRLLREAGVRIAVDRDVETRFCNGDIAVIKPARTSWIPSGSSRFFVTSYMDHAVGQMWAAAEASRLQSSSDSDRLLTCGLLTHRCFENDAFFERIRCDGPRLLPAEGTGLGFDDLLEKLPWKRLN